MSGNPLNISLSRVPLLLVGADGRGALSSRKSCVSIRIGLSLLSEWMMIAQLALSQQGNAGSAECAFPSSKPLRQSG